MYEVRLPFGLTQLSIQHSEIVSHTGSKCSGEIIKKSTNDLQFSACNSYQARQSRQKFRFDDFLAISPEHLDPELKAQFYCCIII